VSGDRIPVIGMVGGIGSGKSTLARWVAERYPVVAIDADRIGHQVLERPDVIRRLREQLGDDILNEQGNIDRARLARRVFGDTPAHHADRQRLEQIVHPEIQQDIERTVAGLDPSATCCVLLDAAVLLESGWDRICDFVIFVDAPEALRHHRITSLRGWSADELARRSASQWPLERKRSAATALVDNAGPIDESGARLWNVVQRLVPGCGRGPGAG